MGGTQWQRLVHQRSCSSFYEAFAYVDFSPLNELKLASLFGDLGNDENGRSVQELLFGISSSCWLHNSVMTYAA